MTKTYRFINRETGEIIAEFPNEKEAAGAIRDIILPDHPQWLAELMVHVVSDQEAAACTLYDFAVQTRVIKGKVKAKKSWVCKCYERRTEE